MLTLIALLIVAAVAVAVFASPLLRVFLSQNTAELGRDFRLLWGTKSDLQLRVQRWKNHVNVYCEIEADAKKPAAPPPAPATPLPPFGVQRIAYLSSDRLRILEGKFSAVLQIQALLGVMVSLLVNKFWDQIKHYAHDWSTGPWLILAFVLWLVTILGCLLSIGNVRWGYIGHDLHPDRVQAEAEYFDDLVHVVVVRTAMLRVLSTLALTNLLLVSALVSFWALRAFSETDKGAANPPPPPQPAVIVPADASYTFPSGKVCAANLDAWVQSVADSVSKGAARKGIATGSADIQPLKPSLARLYRDNVGLAAARARCVADRLTKSLSDRGIPVHLDARVRDRLNQNTVSSQDRVVTVSWLP